MAFKEPPNRFDMCPLELGTGIWLTFGRRSEGKRLCLKGWGELYWQNKEKAALKWTVPKAGQEYMFPKVQIWTPKQSSAMKQLEKLSLQEGHWSRGCRGGDSRRLGWSISCGLGDCYKYLAKGENCTPTSGMGSKEPRKVPVRQRGSTRALYMDHICTCQGRKTTSAHHLSPRRSRGQHEEWG